MSLSVGSKVEAKDFAESWHPAQIMEVDYDEMEVLVHYENKMNKWVFFNAFLIKIKTDNKKTIIITT